MRKNIIALALIGTLVALLASPITASAQLGNPQQVASISLIAGTVNSNVNVVVDCSQAKEVAFQFDYYQATNIAVGASNVVVGWSYSVDGSTFDITGGVGSTNTFQWTVNESLTGKHRIAVTNITVLGTPFLKVNTISNGCAGSITNATLKVFTKKVGS